MFHYFIFDIFKIFFIFSVLSKQLKLTKLIDDWFQIHTFEKLEPENAAFFP